MYNNFSLILTLQTYKKSDYIHKEGSDLENKGLSVMKDPVLWFIIPVKVVLITEKISITKQNYFN